MYRFEWLGFAEGAVSDNRQSITLVGFNPIVLVAELPAAVNLTLVGLADGDDDDPPLEPGAIVTVGLQLEAPDGTLLIAGQQQTPVSASEWPDLPSHVQVIVGLGGISLSEYGRYVAQMRLELPGWSEPVTRRRSLHVKASPVPGRPRPPGGDVLEPVSGGNTSASHPGGHASGPCDPGPSA